MITIERLKTMRESEDHLEFKAARKNYPYNGGKKSDPRERRHCVLGYVVALANEKGGYLVLGMEDKYPHKVCGSDFAEGEEGQLMDAIYEALKIRVKAYSLKEGVNRVLIIEVPSRPIGRLLKFEGVALMRIGESLREMSDAEMLSILTEQEPDYSAKVCKGLTISDLDEDAIDVLKQKYAVKQKNLKLKNEPTQQILNDLELTTDSKLNYAALVLLGSRDAIRKYLPQDEVIVEYRLNEDSIPYTARQEFQEPLMLAIDKIWNYISQPASNPLQYVTDGPYIFDIPSFNEESIREAVLNSLCHRSMLINSSVVIRQSPASITITNAGGFPIGVDVFNILTTPSVPRAKRLCEVLQKTGLIERSGQGVDKIFYNCLEEGKALPDYTLSDAYQVVLKLNGEVEDPAFHLFIDEEQEKRDDDHKLSVFHLLQLYKIKEGQTDSLNSEMVQSLINEGLVVTDNDDLRLCDSYQKKKERMISSREQTTWQIYTQGLGVNPDVVDYIKNIIDQKDIENKTVSLISGLRDKLHVKLSVNTLNFLRENLSVNRYSVLLLLFFNPNLTILKMSELIHVSATTINNCIKWLKAHNIIEREGSDKSGTWKVII